jgi:hypothetical protein
MALQDFEPPCRTLTYMCSKVKGGKEKRGHLYRYDYDRATGHLADARVTTEEYKNDYETSASHSGDS